MNCIDDVNSLSVAGNKMAINNEVLMIQLQRCVGKTYCKNESEIDEFLETYNLFGLAYNTQTYQPNVYEENVIEYKLIGEVRPITTGSRVVR